MKAFQNIRSEMRDSAAFVTNPVQGGASQPARISHADTPQGPGTNIEPWMEHAFRALTHASQTGEPFALVSCFMNGQPAAVIAATRDDGERTHILPLFVACQAGMVIRPHPEDVGEAA
jgi:hypothetical protein